MSRILGFILAASPFFAGLLTAVSGCCVESLAPAKLTEQEWRLAELAGEFVDSDQEWLVLRYLDEDPNLPPQRLFRLPAGSSLLAADGAYEGMTAIVTTAGRVMIIPIAGGDPLASVGVPGARGVGWRRDGARLAVATSDELLTFDSMLTERSRTPLPRTLVENGSVDISWSADDARIAISFQPNGAVGDSIVIELATGRSTSGPIRQLRFANADQLVGKDGPLVHRFSSDLLAGCYLEGANGVLASAPQLGLIAIDVDQFLLSPLSVRVFVLDENRDVFFAGVANRLSTQFFVRR